MPYKHTCRSDVMLAMGLASPDAARLPSSVLSCRRAYRSISSGDSASRSSFSSLMFMIDFATFGVELRSFFLLSL
jgi:hypothetical protein